jgi:2-oxoglutarate ferredoxin oxidoreductase subunit alpha
MVFKPRKDISIVLSGEAGQGLQTLEVLLMKVFKLSGYNVYSYSEFMSRIRGGNNSTQIRVSSQRVASYTKRIDIFVPIHAGAMERFHDRISNETVIVGQRDHIETSYLEGHYPIIEIQLADMAKKAGGEIYTNVILLGVFSGLFYVEEQLVERVLKDFFTTGDEEKIKKNLNAAKIGYESGTRLLQPGQASISIERSENVKHELLMNGIDAVGMGGLAGGCNFVSSYPMSPSTAVLGFFAGRAKEFGVVVEQAEDEISAVNMAIGSWYSGGRALVTTSGGGFALMVEAVSLAGCIESPLVIHLGQRPGPATGLPTRTEQADLELVLYAGHGEFPRVILAPGTIQQGFFLTRQAFYLADKYQVPVFILTDQHFLESKYNIEGIDVSMVLDQHYIVKTAKDYKRYAISDSGISPRGIPGFGDGRVRLDSDEHEEEGFITEDARMRIAMVQKRLRKLDALKEEILPPEFIGPKDYQHLIVGWGSTRHAIAEALDMFDRKDIAFLHFSQVYPLALETEQLLSKARKKIVVENNATCQFGKLIKLSTGIEFDEKILKYDGMPFMPEEILEALKGVV